MQGRLDKIISDALLITRSEAKKVIYKGRVKIDGQTVKDTSMKIDSEKNEIFVDETPISYTQYTYIIFNKPMDCVCANSDSGTTVFDLLEPALLRKDLFCVGRLDKDTTGLLLITNDGDWSHKIISPKSKIQKVYKVTLQNPYTEDMKTQIEQGITLADGTKCLPAVLEKISEYEIYITVFEGKYHQVKRMVAATNNKVVSLCRIKVGDLSLPDDLQLGKGRILEDFERKKIIKN